MASNIYNAVQMPKNTFFYFTAGATTTVVVRDSMNTKVHKSVGFPETMIALLESRGFRRTSFERIHA